jgi:hypothetical protein
VHLHIVAYALVRAAFTLCERSWANLGVDTSVDAAR